MGPRLRLLLASVLLIGSGAASLAHQAVWLRRLFPLVGAGVLSAAIVSAGALLGLGIGAALGGRLADRRPRPGRVFASAEALAAAAALLLLLFTDGLGQLAGVLSGPRAEPGLLASDLLLLGLALLGCALAAIPMGATLPAALRAVRPTPERTGVAFRHLYAWNTVGAVLGVLWAGAVGLEALGNRGTALVAAAVQAAVALLAVLLLAHDESHATKAPSPARPERSPWRLPRGLLLASALAGGAGLAVQVAWVRRLAPVVGNTTQAFTAVLGTYLLGIALGSLLLGPRRGRGPTNGPLVVLVLAAVPLGLLADLILPLARWVGEAYGRSDGEAVTIMIIHAVAAGLVLVPSTVLGAAALPWLVRAADAESDRVGEGSGRLLAWNTAGSAFFAVLTGALFLPLIGSRAVLFLGGGLYLLAAACAARAWLPRLALGVAAVLMCVLPTWNAGPDDALFESVGASFSPGYLPGHSATRRYAEEGQLATVVVRDREGQHELWVDSKIVASSQFTDQMHLALLGHLPMALHPDPKRVAIVGLGTGITAQSVADWKPETLDVFELEPAVARAATWFEAMGGGVPEGARLWYGDGRRSLARSDATYDVITSDPIHPGVAGAAALYSLEYYELLRERADLVCQWLPLYQMALEDARLVVRTFHAAFEQSYIFLSGADALLVGTQSPLAVDEASLRARLDGIGESLLHRLGLAEPGVLLGLLVRGPERVEAFADPERITRGAARGPLNTDDRLLLEFRCGRTWFLRDQAGRNIELLSLGRSKGDTLLAGPPSAAFERELAIATQIHRSLRVMHTQDHERTVEEMQDWLGMQPQSELAYGMLQEARISAAWALIQQGPDVAPALPLIEALASAPRLDWVSRLDLAELYIEVGQGSRAIPLIEAAASRFDWPRIDRLRDSLKR